MTINIEEIHLAHEIKIPNTLETNTEAGMRLLHALNHALDEDAMVILDANKFPYPVIKISPGFTRLLGYDHADAIDIFANIGEPMTHPDDQWLPRIHAENHTSVPFAIRIVKKGSTNYRWYYVEPFTFAVGTDAFRVLVFDRV